MQQFGHSQPELRQPHAQQARLPDPPQLQIHSQNLTPSFNPSQYAAQQHQLNGRPALLQQQQPLSQQFPRPQYIPQQPPQHQQQHFRQPLPVHQQSQQQAQDATQRGRSPTKSRGSKGSPDKALGVDSGAVNIRASSQYPPAQQVRVGAPSPWEGTAA